MPTAQSEIAKSMTAKLMDGSLPKGAKLPSERALADQYGVSRNVIREILSGLADRRLIAIEPGRGAYVTTPSAVDASFAMERASLDRGATPADLIEARLVLETRAAQLAAQRITPTEVERLAALSRAMETPSLVDKARVDLALHLGIAVAARSIVIESLLVSIAPMTVQMMFRSLSDSDVAREGLPHHDQLVTALREGDGVAAQQSIQAHLAVAGDSFGHDYDRPLEVIAREVVERQGGFGGRAALEGQIDALVESAMAMASIRDDQQEDWE